MLPPVLAALLPTALRVPPREAWRAAVGAALAVLLVLLPLSLAPCPALRVPMLAPLGASALLVFAVAASPLAQPWPVVAGNMLGALAGVAAGSVFGATPWAAALAVLMTVIGGFAGRCLHPPACAAALAAVFCAASTDGPGLYYVAQVSAGSVLLVGAAWCWHRMTGHGYPRAVSSPANPHGTRDPLPATRTGFTDRDLAGALADFGEFVDVRREDLALILRKAEALSFQRDAGEITAADIMSRDLVTIGPEAGLADAWRVLQGHRLRALPVIDARGVLLGLVTLPDILRHLVIDAPSPDGIVRFVAPPGARPGAWMAADAPRVTESTHIGELIPLLSGGGVRYLPVVDADGHLRGLVSQTDMIAALFTCWLRCRP